jgi:hypothetical protein
VGSGWNVARHGKPLVDWRREQVARVIEFIFALTAGFVLGRMSQGRSPLPAGFGHRAAAVASQAQTHALRMSHLFRKLRDAGPEGFSPLCEELEEAWGIFAEDLKALSAVYEGLNT